MSDTASASAAAGPSSTSTRDVTGADGSTKSSLSKSSSTTGAAAGARSEVREGWVGSTGGRGCRVRSSGSMSTPRDDSPISVDDSEARSSVPSSRRRVDFVLMEGVSFAK